MQGSSISCQNPIRNWTSFSSPCSMSSWPRPRDIRSQKLKKLRLRDLTDAPFVWFPRWASPAFYDRLMHECYRGGFKSPRIVQEGGNEANFLSLVSTRLGVGWGLRHAPWPCP